jgi:hypothetical protein
VELFLAEFTQYLGGCGYRCQLDFVHLANIVAVGGFIGDSGGFEPASTAWMKL